ncbi:ABC transporter ATP-binding protein/permease [Puniceicoccaceae bacterium K14]|nr:ABC transporter ATP-binding protein/permease [Puniceicoccaceae bacterium K14]
MFKNLALYIKLLSPYKIQFYIGVLAGVVAGAGSAAVAGGAEKLFKVLMESDIVLERAEMIGIALMFPAVFLVIGVSLFISGYYISYCAAKVAEDLRLQLFRMYQDVELSYFQKEQSGTLVSKIVTDCQLLQTILSATARNLITHPISGAASLLYLISLCIREPGLLPVLGSILIIPIIIFPIRYFSRKIQKKAYTQQEEVGNLTSDVSQNISGAKEVRAFNLQESEYKSFSERIAILFKAQMKVVKYTISLSPSVELITSFGLSIAFIVGKTNGVGPDKFIGVFLALYLTYTSIKKFSKVTGELSKGTAIYNRIQETLNHSISIVDPLEPVSKEKLEGAIDFKNVSFSYLKEPALDDINASIAKGEIIALVGPSGAGKSTFAHLIPRFYDINLGELAVDGIDVRQLSQKQLRDNIAIVSQDPVLFDISIKENIRLGKLDASDQEIFKAARLAFADDFIQQQDQGYETIVGERGARLSGGQKQRIAIARAFLRNAPILILDEATSALDSESETKIQKALEQLVTGKTVLIIAHRFSTIKIANRIFVFEKGKIIDKGNHAELYEGCDLYKSLVDKQSN